MSLVSVTGVRFLGTNPAPFCEPLRFEVSFECYEALPDDLEWRIVYIGSAETSSHDQVLDEIEVGPVPVGAAKFEMISDPPDPSKIPADDLLGITAVLLTCHYHQQEFLRIGYYVQSEYDDPSLAEMQPDPPRVDRIRRTVIEEPRVTRYNICWHGNPTAPPPTAATTTGGAAVAVAEEPGTAPMQPV
ncbi:putative Histone chaperone ASF1B [Paratrimastix pyriformis]|uniref:Histone chaperone ASF1B n=1 Tax=Paratrimastix pyriformis TaxID=342808 RepID=A0ABQ8U7W6_9EUKA|nr:putative Histone chaperone ASF1B [Paratrimastix pyriformis]